MRQVAATCAALLLCSCGTKEARAPFVLRVAMVGPLEPLTSDPSEGYTALAQEWVYEQLIRIGDDGTLQPALAERLQRRGRGLHFVIRPGATFSDGSPVRAADVIASLARHSLQGRSDGEGIWIEPPASGEPIDAILPFVVVGISRGSGHLGSGPFRVVEGSPTRIILDRIHPQPSHIQRIELLGFGSPREALARTLAGDAELLPRVEPRLAEFFDGVGRLRLVHARSTQAATIAFSMRLSLADRRALASLFSTSDLGTTAFGGTCSGWTPQPTVGRSYLPNGRRLDILSPPIDVGYERLALGARRSLGSRGGQVRRVAVREVVQAWSEGTFDLFTSPALVWPPVAAGAKFHSGSVGNLWKYSDRSVDEALDRSDWGGALEALSRNPPLAFICLQEKLVAVDSRIKNPRLGALAPLEFVPEWEVGQ